MEPIDYRQALLRRWRLILVLALLGAVIGVALPLHVPHPIPHTEYQTSTLVGVAPGGGPPTLSEIDFFAANLQVIGNAAKAAGIKASPAQLQKDVTVTSGGKKKSASPNGTLTLAVKQGTPKRSEKLTNAFAQALGNYIQTNLNNQYQNQLQAAQANVCNLETQVNNIDNEIAQIVSPTGSSSSSSSPMPSYCNGSNSSSTAYVVPAGGGQASLTASSSSSTSPTTTTTSPSSGGARSNPQLADLEAQSQALTTQYVAAVQKVQSLTDAGAPQSGYIILQPAQASLAKVIPGGVSLLDHHSVRAGIGALVGAAVAAGIAILMAGLDKRLRTTGRAKETFGYTVIAEIPAATSPRTFRRQRQPAPVAPTIPVVSAPSSLQAEAYRMLRMAVELGPLAVGAPEMASQARPGSQTNGTASLVPATRVASAGATAGEGVTPQGAGTPLWISEPSSTAAAVRWQTGAPGSAGVSAPVARPGPRGRRHPVLLVVSPGTEPTRSLVTANLAAAYAEAGLQVHIVTTEDLRADGSVPPAGLFHRPEGIGIDEVDAHSTPTQIPGVRRLGLAELLDGPGQLASVASDLVAICRQMADVVLLDAPSLITTFDAEALLPVVDTVLVVGESAMTTVDDARRSGELLRRVKAPVIGVALTNVAPRPKDLRAARAAKRAARTRRAPRMRRASPKRPTRSEKRRRKTYESETTELLGQSSSRSQVRRHLVPKRSYREGRGPSSASSPKRFGRRKLDNG